MTTIPDPDLRPKPGGLIREQDQPQEISDLERHQDDPVGDREDHDERPGVDRPR